MNINVSSNFKKMAVKAILSILLFIVSYLVLVILAAALTVGFGYAGFMLIVFKPMFLTIMLGLGIMSVGVFILIFLFKFITKKHTTDRSHLQEISSADEPALFSLIREVVNEVKTPFPKKVYLSYDVNAAVFYNSTFWSMIFPVRKNLQIGVGLINSVSTSELKAILAHEFGHFSQRSMKVGSYVYNVNQVIHNLLFENESYSEILGGWANASNYFKVFAELAAKIIQGIQWILGKVYVVVNISYMALSREMEFHADEVAAYVTGPKPLVSSLLRLGLADQTFNSVLDYYGRQVDKSVKTSNVYVQHGWLMNFIAAENNMQLESGLPNVSNEDMSRFNKSKLVVKDQWASHPSTAERIEHLRNLMAQEKEVNNVPASSLFHDKNTIQEVFTEKLFKPVHFKNPPSIKTMEHFIDDYTKTFYEGSFNKIYNGYYDNKDIDLQILDAGVSEATTCYISDLFNDVSVEMVYAANSQEGDLASLKQIAEGVTGIKSFDYDGQRYSVKDTAELIAKLTNELSQQSRKIEDHDSKIYNYFFHLAEQQGKKQELTGKYRRYGEVKEEFTHRVELYNLIISEMQFLQHNTPFETIEQNFVKLTPIEKKLKVEINKILADEHYQSRQVDEINVSFNTYLNNSSSYFTRPEYNQDALDLLYAAIGNFYTAIQDTVFYTKKSLLEYQANLLPQVDKGELVSESFFESAH